LARAFADLDLFVFPSQTDTFGMAVLEAQASGVPAVVMAQGGPRHVIRPGETGLVAANEDELANAVLHLIRNQAKRSSMASAARRWARSFSQTEAFEDLYQAYALVRRSGNVVF
jgi:glycosyltransferase involved in cell wall biosynthesis